MLYPSESENLEFNLIVIGSKIIKKLKRKQHWNIEELFQEVRNDIPINLERFYNSLCFLWLADVIQLDKNYVVLNK